eukprot:TRINITY_DN7799_c1_g3_i1.p2 TRINITY_DN7799_c1_g3~~TRINITY_DN7799_c1_g3_i1.p2  ORF type:complete len:227 (-),score=-20.74 TRINITY_DN7799_c1_g3_i1:185-865(-)
MTVSEPSPLFQNHQKNLSQIQTTIYLLYVRRDYQHLLKKILFIIYLDRKKSHTPKVFYIQLIFFGSLKHLKSFLYVQTQDKQINVFVRTQAKYNVWSTILRSTNAIKSIFYKTRRLFLPFYQQNCFQIAWINNNNTFTACIYLNKLYIFFQSIQLNQEVILSQIRSIAYHQPNSNKTFIKTKIRLFNIKQDIQQYIVVIYYVHTNNKPIEIIYTIQYNTIQQITLP